MDVLYLEQQKYFVMKDFIEADKCCKFINIRENFIFANSDKRHFCDVKISRLGHD